MMRFTLAAVAAISLGLPAFAGEQYLDATGFAVSGYDVVAYRGLSSNTLGTEQVAGVPGRSDITAEYNDATFAFSSEGNLARFLENPAYYAPQYDGHCAYGVSRGGKVPGNPNLWRIVDDKLYLNITKTVVTFWEEDIPGNINLAQGNWPKIEDTDASGNKIPNFTSAAPENG